MYRVAVIENASETIRAGYANVAQNLCQVPGLEDYVFDSFDSNNIRNLFSAGDQSLDSYDSLFISTNATSDATAREILIQKRDSIDKYLSAGKGIFFSYQKKMNSRPGTDQPEREQYRILPEYYDVVMMERPATEPDSGEGRLDFADIDPTIASPAARLVLNHPEHVTIESTRRHCMENDFKRHQYRSHILPCDSSAYDELIVDASYDGPPRRLLVANRTSAHGERVIVSTIAIDWEFHHRLLRNILTYISEGVPRIAFFSKPDTEDRDFKHLTSTARMVKVPHVIYGNLRQPSEDLAKVHNTYVLSAGWSDSEVESFWARLGGRDPPNPKFCAFRRERFP